MAVVPHNVINLDVSSLTYFKPRLLAQLSGKGNKSSYKHVTTLLNGARELKSTLTETLKRMTILFIQNTQMMKDGNLSLVLLYEEGTHLLHSLGVDFL
jgi:hypothetical protein